MNTKHILKRVQREVEGSRVNICNRS